MSLRRIAWIAVAALVWACVPWLALADPTASPSPSLRKLDLAPSKGAAMTPTQEILNAKTAPPRAKGSKIKLGGVCVPAKGQPVNSDQEGYADCLRERGTDPSLGRDGNVLPTIDIQK